MREPYSTRSAGFEFGSTKLAALATNAQMVSIGIGSAFARRADAQTRRITEVLREDTAQRGTERRAGPSPLYSGKADERPKR